MNSYQRSSGSFLLNDSIRDQDLNTDKLFDMIRKFF